MFHIMVTCMLCFNGNNSLVVVGNNLSTCIRTVLRKLTEVTLNYKIQHNCAGIFMSTFADKSFDEPNFKRPFPDRQAFHDE